MEALEHAILNEELDTMSILRALEELDRLDRFFNGQEHPCDSPHDTTMENLSSLEPQELLPRTIETALVSEKDEPMSCDSPHDVTKENLSSLEPQEVLPRTNETALVSENDDSVESPGPAENLPCKKSSERHSKISISSIIPCSNHPLHATITQFTFMNNDNCHHSPLFTTTEHPLIPYDWIGLDTQQAALLKTKEAFTDLVGNILAGVDHTACLKTFQCHLNSLKKQLTVMLFTKLRLDYSSNIIDYPFFKSIKSQHSYRLRIITARITSHIDPHNPEITYDDINEAWEKSWHLRRVVLTSY